MRKLLAVWCSVVLSAGLALAQDFEQVNTTSPQSLSNKTLVAAVFSGVFTGTYTLGGTPTITGATLTSPLLNTPTIVSPTFSGTVLGTYTLGGSPSLVAAVLSGSFTGTYTLAGTPTITAPAISNPTLSGGGILGGTYTGTYTLAGAPTITAPAISSPTFTGGGSFAGTYNGTYTLASPTLVSPTITSGVVTAEPTANLGIANKAYVDNRGPPNPIINGNMEIWQRGTTFVGAGNIYTADRWKVNGASAAVVNVNQSTNLPTVGNAGVLFNYSLEVDVTTADAAVGATDNYAIEHHIEGFNWRHFAQRQFTLSFWVFATKTGTHCVSFRSSNGDRAFIAEYTVTSVDTWEYKTVTVAASPSAGTWNYQNQRGLLVSFVLMAGSNYQGSAGAWNVTTTQFATSNQVNDLDNTANFFRITGVQLELGSVATPIQFVPFEVELARCKRYYQKSFQYATAPAQNVGANTGYTVAQSTVAGAVTALLPVYLPVQLRSSSISVTLYNPLAANGQIRNFTDSADFTGSTTTVNSESSFVISGTGNASLAAGEQFGVHWQVDAEL